VLLQRGPRPVNLRNLVLVTYWRIWIFFRNSLIIDFLAEKKKCMYYTVLTPWPLIEGAELPKAR